MSKFKIILLFVICLSLTAGVAFGMDVTLQWDAPTSQDVVKAKIFYKAGLPGEPWDGTGADQGASPITMDLTTQDENPDPLIIEYTITGLPNADTSFVLKAVDDYDRESSYSNAVTVNGEVESFQNLRVKDIVEAFMHCLKNYVVTNKW